MCICVPVRSVFIGINPHIRSTAQNPPFEHFYNDRHSFMASRASLSGIVTGSWLFDEPNSHFRKAVLMASGAPVKTTVPLGINGRSSSETARMPYSCAKKRAVRKFWMLGEGFEVDEV